MHRPVAAEAAAAAGAAVGVAEVPLHLDVHQPFVLADLASGQLARNNLASVLFLVQASCQASAADTQTEQAAHNMSFRPRKTIARAKEYPINGNLASNLRWH